MKSGKKNNQELTLEIERLQARLAEAEETLQAIRGGEVDALLVSGAAGDRVYTLENADSAYRLLVENMQEGAVTLLEDGSILYCNQRFAEILGQRLENLLGTSFDRFVDPNSEDVYRALRMQCHQASSSGEIQLVARGGARVPIYLSLSVFSLNVLPCISGVVTDLSEQKRNEQIAADERLARAILDQAAECIVVCDTRGMVIRASQEAQRFAPIHPLSQPFDIAFPLRLSAGNESRKNERFSCAPALRGEKIENLEVGLLAGETVTHTLLVNAGPLCGSQGEILGCVISMTDITERKRAEKALRESQQRYAAIHDHAAIAIALFKWPGGLITEVNEAYEKIFGWPRQEAIGKTSVELGLVSDPDARLRMYEELRAHGSVRDWEMRYRTRSGEDRLGRFNFDLIEIGGEQFQLGTAIDITEQKAAQEKLFQAHALLDTILARAPIGFAYFDRDLRYVLINDRLAEINGRPVAAHIGRLVHDIVPTLVEAATAVTGRILATGEAVKDHEFSGETAAEPGVTRYWNESWYPLRNAAGEIVGFGAIVEEITERKRAEEALREARDQLELRVCQRTADLAEAKENIHALAARLAELEETERRLLARELHDQIGQTLSVLGINLTFVRGGLAAETPHSILEHLDDALAQVKQLTSRVRNIMSELRPAVLDDFGLLAALRWYGDQFSKRTGILVEIPGGDMVERLPVAAETALFRITQEALTNVVKYARASRVELLLEETINSVCLTIADDGVGFDPALKADPQGQSGWGHLIMRERIAALGGRLALESEPGSGTRIIAEIER